MTTDALSKVHTARPFRPFAMRLCDGRRLPVARPEMLAYAPKRRTAFVYLEDGSFEIIDLPTVTALEVPSLKRRGGKRN